MLLQYALAKIYTDGKLSYGEPGPSWYKWNLSKHAAERDPLFVLRISHLELVFLSKSHLNKLFKWNLQKRTNAILIENCSKANLFIDMCLVRPLPLPAWMLCWVVVSPVCQSPISNYRVASCDEAMCLRVMMVEDCNIKGASACSCCFTPKNPVYYFFFRDTEVLGLFLFLKNIIVPFNYVNENVLFIHFQFVLFVRFRYLFPSRCPSFREGDPWFRPLGSPAGVWSRLAPSSS